MRAAELIFSAASADKQTVAHQGSQKAPVFIKNVNIPAVHVRFLTQCVPTD